MAYCARRFRSRLATFRPCGSSAGVIECIDDWALADELREIAGRKPVCTGTDRGLLRSVLGPWSPVPKCEAPGHPFQWKNTLPWHLGPAAKVRILRFKIFRHSRYDPSLQNHVLRYSPGLAPTTRLNALLNEASDS